MKKKITALVLAVIMCLSFIISVAAADTLKRVPSTIPGTDKEYNYVENVTVKIPGTNVTLDFKKVADFVLVDNKYSFKSNIAEVDFDIPVYYFYIFESDGTVTINQDSTWMSASGNKSIGNGINVSFDKGSTLFRTGGYESDSSLWYDCDTIITLNDNCIGDIEWETDIEELKETAIARVVIEKINRYYDFDDSYNKVDETWYKFDNHDETIDISTLDVNYTPDEDYKITDGANAVVNSDTKSLKIRADGDFSKFTGVKVDGKTVDSSNYTASEGSTVIEFKGEYLNMLNTGKHTVEILFTDGKATTHFEIKRDKNTDKPQSPNVEIPNTDGSSSVTSIFAVMALSGMALITFRNKKKK